MYVDRSRRRRSTIWKVASGRQNFKSARSRGVRADAPRGRAVAADAGAHAAAGVAQRPAT